jgi:hypothetical protein
MSQEDNVPEGWEDVYKWAGVKVYPDEGGISPSKYPTRKEETYQSILTQFGFEF